MSEPNTSQDRSEKEIFFEALDKHTPEERAAYLDGACGRNPTLRAKIEALLADHLQHDSFMKKPAIEGQRPTIKVVPISEVAGTVIGRYKLLQQIGEGGCGVVYMAEQQEPVSRRVALKVIKLGMDTKGVIARFEAERQALAMMDHPNIAKVLDAGATDAGRPYFVMELVRGIKITDYCDQNNLSTRERLDLFIQVCRAVQHAHQKGIIHRDIKPSNILVTMHDGVPVPKVIDFGIAKATTGKLTDQTLFTAYEQFIGTPAYMSPEQAEMSALDIDTRSDIYSLGVLLYELLTGQTPFNAKDLLQAGLDEIRRTIREQEPARPSTCLSTMQGADLTTIAKHRKAEAPSLVHLVRGDLDWIVMKALEKDRTRRYETANGLAADLKRHLDNEPITARPPSAAYRLQKAFRRNKLAFVAAAIVVLALMAGLALAAMGWRQTRVERDRALRAQAAEEVQRKAAQASEQKAQLGEAEAAHLLYAADINLAQQAWDQNNFVRLGQLIENTREAPYRGFEWYYWEAKTRLPFKALRGHSNVVMSVAYSPDGQRIVTGSVDRTAKVWDAASGGELLTLKGHAGWIHSVAFSPDSQRIVTGSLDNTAKVWDAASGRELLTLKGHSDFIRSVAFSPNGQEIVTGSDDKTAKIWDASSGLELLALKGHSGSIFSVAFSPDGKRIATGSSVDNTVRVWDAQSGKDLLTLKGHAAGISTVAFSPDGQRVVSSSWDRTAKVWNAADGRELMTLIGHVSPVFSVAFSPDSQRIVTGSLDNTAKVWDAASGHEVLTLKGASSWICAVSFSPDGKRIITGGGDNAAKIWEASSGLSPDRIDGNLLTLKGHRAEIDSIAISSDGRRIVTGSEDNTAKLWETGTGKELLILKGHSDFIRSVAISPDGREIVTGSGDKTAKVWDAATGQEVLWLKGHTNAVTSVAFSPDGRRVVTASRDHTAKVWDAANGRELLMLDGKDDLWCAAFSPDNQRIVTGSSDRSAKVWDAATGKELLSLTGHSGWVDSVAFSPDGRRLVTGSSDHTAKVWNAATGKELVTLQGHTAEISSVGFSPDEQRIATASYDGTAKVWEASTGRELLTLKGHGSGVSSVAFSPDGFKIVTGSWDTTAKIWQTATKEQAAKWQTEDAAAVKQ